MIKNLIAAGILAAAAMAQVPPGQSEASAKEQVRIAIPDFRVTAESLRQAQQHSPKILDTADYELGETCCDTGLCLAQRIATPFIATSSAKATIRRWKARAPA